MVVVEVVDGDATVATVRIEGDVPHLFVVDAYARLELAARRVGWTARLVDAGAELREVLALAGEERWQAERREQRRVEEVVQPGEPPAR